jgi:hypothetical protein
LAERSQVAAEEISQLASKSVDSQSVQQNAAATVWIPSSGLAGAFPQIDRLERTRLDRKANKSFNNICYIIGTLCAG